MELEVEGQKKKLKKDTVERKEKRYDGERVGVVERKTVREEERGTRRIKSCSRHHISVSRGIFIC